MYAEGDNVKGALYNESASKTVRTVPLTLVDIHGTPTRPAHEPTYRPLGIGEENVGSNVGLIRNLQDLARRQREMKCYIPVISDVAIFRRILSVTVLSTYIFRVSLL